ncbi:hypothetical protein PG990_007369 [Apiospora arundinis]
MLPSQDHFLHLDGLDPLFLLFGHRRHVLVHYELPGAVDVVQLVPHEVGRSRVQTRRQRVLDGAVEGGEDIGHEGSCAQHVVEIQVSEPGNDFVLNLRRQTQLFGAHFVFVVSWLSDYMGRRGR